MGLFVGVRRQRLQLIQRLGRVLRFEEDKEKPLIIIPVNRNTWEDPNLQGNERLQYSALNLIVQHADVVHVTDVANSSQIQRILAEYSLPLLPLDLNSTNQLVA